MKNCTKHFWREKARAPVNVCPFRNRLLCIRSDIHCAYGSTIYRCLVISSAPQVGVTSVLQRILNTLKQLGQSKPNFMWSILRIGETKVCINGPGHMTKVATRAINSKNLKESSSLEPVDRFQ